MAIWMGSGTVGGLIDAESARISVFDHGFTVGDGIFETMRSVDGRLFLWPWHLERLQASANAMRVELPEGAFLTDVVQHVARESVTDIGRNARVRLTISAGLGPLGSNRLPSPPTVVCAASEMPVRHGDASLRIASWTKNERSPLTGVKSTSYAEQVLALTEAESAGAGESVFMNSLGYLCEGTASNVFVVHGGVVSTPPPSAGLLRGVTRRFVLGLGDHEVPIHERNVTRDEFLNADEVFITSTFQDVRGVNGIDGRHIAVGPITRALQARFAAAAAQEQCWT